MTANLTSDLCGFMSPLYCRLTKYNQQRADASTFFEACSDRTYQIMDISISRMIMELETAGVAHNDNDNNALYLEDCYICKLLICVPDDIPTL